MSNQVSPFIIREVAADESGKKIVVILDYYWLYNKLRPIVGIHEAEKTAEKLLLTAFSRQTLKMTLEFHRIYGKHREAIIGVFFD